MVDFYVRPTILSTFIWHDRVCPSESKILDKGMPSGSWFLTNILASSKCCITIHLAA
jgi:hypothetical protein